MIRDGATITVNAPIVVSDIGPAATVKLLGEDNVPTDYQDLVKKGDRPTAMISVNFASQERLVNVPGMLSFAKSRRLAYIANFTDTCPEMAPPGWNLYVGTAVPKPSIGDFDDARRDRTAAAGPARHHRPVRRARQDPEYRCHPR